MMKMVVLFNPRDQRSKGKIIRTVASCPGISTISMDDGWLTIKGDFNIMMVLQKLKTKWRCAKLVTYGPYDPMSVEREHQGLQTIQQANPRVQTPYANQQANPGPWFYPPVHHYPTVYESDHNNGCVIV